MKEVPPWVDEVFASFHDEPPHGDTLNGKANGAGKRAIHATPFVWIDPASIPPRKFLYGKHLVRQFVSTTISHGGGGKSALEITEALAMTSNRALLGIQPSEPLCVWYWNGEDPRAEIDRRVMATALHYGLTADSIGRLYTDVGRETPIIIAEQTRDGAKILVPVVDAVIKTIQDEHIDVAIIDPFVSSHRVTENDNNAIELVVKKWAHIADVTNAAIELVHHSRKTGADVTVQDGRGAIALLAAARSARVLNVMSENEAGQAGVEHRKWYFRVDNGKANLTPPVDKAEWFKFVSVALANGDNVGVPTSWQFPERLRRHNRRPPSCRAEGRGRRRAVAREPAGQRLGRKADRQGAEAQPRQKGRQEKNLHDA